MTCRAVSPKLPISSFTRSSLRVSRWLLFSEARMAQRFLSLNDAAAQLGISKDRLNELRQANKVTGYKDGTSWKFRAEAIEKLAVEGIPQIEPPPSDISLGLDD